MLCVYSQLKLIALFLLSVFMFYIYNVSVQNIHTLLEENKREVHSKMIDLAVKRITMNQ